MRVAFRAGVALADGRPYHEAGGERGAGARAFVMASAIAYLQRPGRPAATRSTTARETRLSFLLVADADEFMSVAKMRALRRLWSARRGGLRARPGKPHSPSRRDRVADGHPARSVGQPPARHDGGVLGRGRRGRTIVTVLPFTAAIGLPDAFARRLARNTQAILHRGGEPVWRVADPAAGCWADSRRLTQRARRGGLGPSSRAIEREGGIVASLATGALQARIAAIRQVRETAVATRRDPITGTSEFPDLQEVPVSVLMTAPPETSASSSPGRQPTSAASRGFAELVGLASRGERLADLSPTASAVPAPFEPLLDGRAAEPFERLRWSTRPPRARPWSCSTRPSSPTSRRRSDSAFVTS